MAPYKLIKGSDKNIAAFEEQIANAMLDGYELANDLVVMPKSSGEEVLLFQAMICDEILEYDDEDEEDEDDDEEFED